MDKCPGQDSRSLTVGLHPCPNCSALVEVFSDEQRSRCPECGTMVFTEETPTCVEWCQAAKECLGPERYEKVMEALGRAVESAEGRQGEK